MRYPLVHERPAFILALLLVPFLSCALGSPAFSSVTVDQPTVSELLEKMKSAYAAVHNYQTEIQIDRYNGENDGPDTERLLYTFKKPNLIRIDFKSPHSGLVLVYPDENGKVVVRPSWPSFVKLHLSPENPLLDRPSGQRIDQTDFGLLIQNLEHSLTDRRKGPAHIEENAGLLQVSVLAENSFKQEVIRYLFLVDKSSWLPAGVRESTRDGVLMRSVTFNNLKTNLDIPADFFQL